MIRAPFYFAYTFIILRDNSYSDIESLIPLLIQLMSNEATFIGASDVLQEIMTNSSFTYGINIKTLTVPVLDYLEVRGASIVQRMLETGDIGEIEHSLCKLLVALGVICLRTSPAYLDSTRQEFDASSACFPWTARLLLSG